MAFKKGHKRSPKAGMKKGQKSAKVQAWESLRDKLLGGLTDKAIKELQELEGKDFLYIYSNLLEFFKPKLSRSEVEHSGETTQKVIQLSDDQINKIVNG